MTMKQPGYMFSAWENYKEWESTCPDCQWTGLPAQAISDNESEMVTSLRCPKCERKLALMNNQASQGEIAELAARSSNQAIRHLKRKAEQEAKEGENGKRN